MINTVITLCEEAWTAGPFSYSIAVYIVQCTRLDAPRYAFAPELDKDKIKLGEMNVPF